MDSAFDLFFDGLMGMNQIMMLLGAGICLLIGGALIVYPFYVALTGQKVTGKISGIRVSQYKGLVEEEPEPKPEPAKPKKEKRSWAAFGAEFRKSPGTGIGALFVLLFMLGIPLTFVGIGGWLGYDYLNLRASGIYTVGTVTRNEHDTDSEGGSVYYAHVKYQDEEGRSYTEKDNFGGGKPSYKVGEDVPVYYERGNPGHMSVGGFWHNMGLPVGFVFIGALVLFFIFGGGQWIGDQFKSRRKKRPGRKKKISYTGEMYAPVYEYRSGGQVIEAEGGSSSSWMLSILPGKKVRLRIDPSDPQKVERPGFLLSLVGLIFLVPGILMSQTAMKMEFTATGLLVFLLIMVVPGFRAFKKLKGIIKPRELWESKGQFKARMKEKHEAKKAQTHVLTRQEIRDRAQHYASGAGRGWTFFMVLVALGLMVGGVYLGRDMTAFLTKGVAAPGEVVRIESVYNSSSDGSSYTYYPVVRFKAESGDAVEFRDSVGSNPAMYQRGDDVKVLYDPELPQDAMIDRGIWNWSASLGCFGGGLFLLLLSVRALGQMRRARAWR